ncbi:MAG: leucine-rich repeat domain-containing protein, partial [Armatimonadota bacterium]
MRRADGSRIRLGAVLACVGALLAITIGTPATAMQWDGSDFTISTRSTSNSGGAFAASRCFASGEDQNLILACQPITNSPSPLYVVRMAKDGTVLDPNGLLLNVMIRGNTFGFGVCTDRHDYYVVYNRLGPVAGLVGDQPRYADLLRVTPEGTVSAPVCVDDCTLYPGYVNGGSCASGVATNGASVLVASRIQYTTLPRSAIGYVLVDAGDNFALIRRVLADQGGTQFSYGVPAVGTDGTNYLIAYRRSDGYMRTALVEGATGTLLGNRQLTAASSATDRVWVRFHDGAYHVWWSGGDGVGTYMMRVGTDGVPLDAAPRHLTARCQYGDFDGHSFVAASDAGDWFHLYRLAPDFSVRETLTLPDYGYYQGLEGVYPQGERLLAIRNVSARLTGRFVDSNPIHSVSPESVANDGPCELTLTGGFDASYTPVLVLPDGTEVQATSVARTGNHTIVAVFEVTAAPTGPASLRIYSSELAAPYERTGWVQIVRAQASGVLIVETGERHPSIQAAINAAGHGQTVAVPPGTYYESINFGGKSITVRSEAPDDPDTVAATIIHGGGNGSVVRFDSGETPDAVLRGLTIKGGSAEQGGGIFCADSHPTISKNVIVGNHASSQGGGIYCRHGAPTITGNTVAANTAPDGGGIFSAYGTAIITGNIVSHNTAVRHGGGIYCALSGPAISNNTVSHNRTAAGGSLHFADCPVGGPPVVTNNIIFLDTEGAGVHVESGAAPVLTYSNVYGNVDGEYVGMPDPTGTSGNISADPLFADAANGDFHLKSYGGRRDPVGGSWVTDAVHSPCIDAGDPATPVGDEPWPNGGRINMGAHGGTAEASKSGTVVNFPDTRLDAVIRDAIGKPAGDIYAHELTGLVFLSAENADISDLTGLEHCTGLTELYLDHNEISNLTPLAGLTALERLQLYRNAVSDLAPLAALTALNHLVLVDNQISDLTPLAGLTALKGLYLDQNAVSDLTPVAGLTALTELVLTLNQISDITPLAGLTQLQWLGMGINRISDLTPLAGLTALKRLSLHCNEVSDLGPLAGLTGLQWLDLSLNQIGDLTALAGLTALEWLDLRSNEVGDVTPVANLTALVELDLGSNRISELTPLAPLTALQWLSVEWNWTDLSEGSPAWRVVSGLQDRGATVLHDNQTPRRLYDALARVSTICYSPTNYDPGQGIEPTEAGIADDLRTLRDLGFGGIVTYGSDGMLAEIPRIARANGFEVVIQGICDPLSQAELSAAAAAAAHVTGYCVGHEGLVRGDYTVQQVHDAMVWMRQQTDLCVVTSEPWSEYLSNADLRDRCGPLVFATCHPLRAGYQDPVAGARWTVARYQELSAAIGTTLAWFKETGWATAGAPWCTEEAQRDFFSELQGAAGAIGFCRFAAFDQPWREDILDGYDVGPHWGLLTADRQPKQAAGPAHEVTITEGPAGDPNPVASGGEVLCSVTAVDSLGHDLKYAW